MVIETSTIICSQCKAKVPVKSVKANKTGTDWICLDCYGKEHKDSQGSVKSKWVNDFEMEKKTVVNKEDEKKEKSYYCSKCIYSFTRKGIYAGKCPYCGRENTIKLENAREDWIEDFLE